MKEPLDEEAEAMVAEYGKLLHAMQTGVKYCGELLPDGKQDQEPKHLRVGINAALANCAALAALLIAKGVFTRREYLTALCAEMRKEVTRYEAKLSKATGKKITCG